jgi:alpha-ribazole phosphatase
MHLLLVTHAQTDWNVQGRFQGHSDVPLNSHGRQQAVKLQQRLAQESFQAVLASDLCRAWETAEMVARPHNLLVQREPRLRELHFGAWEGLTYDEIQQHHPQRLADWQANPLHITPPDGEGLLALSGRLQTLLQEIKKRRAELSILLVAHRGSLRVLLSLLLDKPVEKNWDFHLDLASLSELEIWGDNVSLVHLNEIPGVQEGVT